MAFIALAGPGSQAAFFVMRTGMDVIPGRIPGVRLFGAVKTVLIYYRRLRGTADVLSVFKGIFLQISCS